MRRSRNIRALLAWAAIAMLALGGCGLAPTTRSTQVTEGSVAAGEEALDRYGCGACHQIPGVAGADGQVGPPLDAFGERAYIAGRLTNNQANLVRWIRNPQRIDPQTAMPNLGVDEDDATNMAAYLLSLE